MRRRHGKLRSAVSLSCTIGRSGALELADECITSDQIAAREKREREVEAAFAALQDEIPVYPPRWRAILEALCVENVRVPQIWLLKMRCMLEKIAKAARIPGQRVGKGTGGAGMSTNLYRRGAYVVPTGPAPAPRGPIALPS
jgi:hypothetical protein